MVVDQHVGRAATKPAVNVLLIGSLLPHRLAQDVLDLHDAVLCSTLAALAHDVL
jgi:hypothetical protein